MAAPSRKIQTWPAATSWGRPSSLTCCRRCASPRKRSSAQSSPLFHSRRKTTRCASPTTASMASPAPSGPAISGARCGRRSECARERSPSTPTTASTLRRRLAATSSPASVASWACTALSSTQRSRTYTWSCEIVCQAGARENACHAGLDDSLTLARAVARDEEARRAGLELVIGRKIPEALLGGTVSERVAGLDAGRELRQARQKVLAGGPKRVRVDIV